MIVLSLYDHTGIMVQPWADAGYECFIVDIQHPEDPVTVGNITKIKLNLNNLDSWTFLADLFSDQKVIIFGFPVCTDLSISGAKHWAGKRQIDPDFQLKAVQPFHHIVELADKLGAPYMMENPESRAVQLFRKPDFRFSPNEFGGYLSANEPHPLYPNHIPLQDAYEKTTCLWIGNGFILPTKNPVPPRFKLYRKGTGELLKVSEIVAKTGGDSARTKNIRSATPRGFARAVYYANGRA